jgi:spore coat protein U-like protein
MIIEGTSIKNQMHIETLSFSAVFQNICFYRLRPSDFSSPANSSNAVARNQMLEINCSKMKLLDCNFSRNTSSSNCNFSKMFCSNLYGRKWVIGV